MTVVRHVAKQSVADAVFHQVRDAIISGEQPAGSLLPSERDLAQQAGVNRQAVREALQRLRQQRLVEIVQGEGVRVLDWTNEAQLSVLFDAFVHADGSMELSLAAPILRLRLVALVDAARLAAERRDPDGVADLRRMLADMRAEAADTPVNPRFDYWERVVEMSGNLAYRLTYNSQMRLAARLDPGVVVALAAGARLLEEYEAITDAIAAGDADRAAELADVIIGAIVRQLEGTS